MSEKWNKYTSLGNASKDRIIGEFSHKRHKVDKAWSAYKIFKFSWWT